MKDRLRRVQDRLEELEEEVEEGLLQVIPDQTKLDRLKEVMELRIAAEKRRLIERDRQEPQPEGEQWGPVPDAWWQAAHLVLGPSSILRQEDQLPPEFPGSSGGCGSPPAGLRSISRGRGHVRNRAPKSTGCVQGFACCAPLLAEAPRPCSHVFARQVLVRHNGRAAPWRWQHGGKC